jgi:5-methylcytosine-specific restriction endonuclease McrA
MSRSGIPNYRRLAFKAYQPICVHCGYGITDVLEVAHLDGNASNCSLENLVILCPTCHRMHDIGLIPTEHLIRMRDEERSPDWGKLIKDGAAKAHATRRADPESYSRAALKAHETMRARNAEAADDTGQ